MHVSLFLFNDTATTEIYTLSLHDALPISEDEQLRRPVALKVLRPSLGPAAHERFVLEARAAAGISHDQDRKSTRLNSSHLGISYAVFCLKKKRTTDGTYVIGTALRVPKPR